MKMSYRVDGDIDLQNALLHLATFPQRSGGKILAQEQRKALVPVRTAVKRSLRRGAGRRYGFLARAYVIRSGGRRGTVSTMILGVSKKRYGKYYPVRYAHLVEFGTKPHWQPRLGRMHPGARKIPHLRPAWEQNRKRVVDSFGRGLTLAVEKEARRIARPPRRSR